MRTEGLRDDRRGAILLIAVFMAVFLVGCLWYLVGIGDAAIYREKMQDGSDAVVFASAVYHARGMNIIAVLNLIMAAALAVLIAFKVAQLLAVMIAAIATALCPWTGWTCPVAGEATAIATNLQTSVIPNVQQVVDTILKACSASQVWVAQLSPWVGAARGAIAAQSYTPTVTAGVALSISMVPSGARLGLPVQEEPFNALCTRAGTLLAGLAFGWIPGFSLVGSLFGKLTGTFPSYFCGGSSGGISTQDQTQTIQTECTQAEQAYNQANQNNASAKPFDMKQCEADAATALQKSGGTTTSGLGSSTTGETSKMIFASAQNGDDYFQVYGFVTGDNTSAQQNAKSRVEMPAWGKASIQTNPATDALEKTGVSQAEFYYDQVTAGQLAWADYQDDALWNMRWRARLRRFRLPTQVSLGALSGAISSVPGVPASLQQAGQSWVSGAAQTINGAVGAVVIH
jgi:hypothetical protein